MITCFYHDYNDYTLFTIPLHIWNSITLNFNRNSITFANIYFVNYRFTESRVIITYVFNNNYLVT